MPELDQIEKDDSGNGDVNANGPGLDYEQDLLLIEAVGYHPRENPQGQHGNRPHEIHEDNGDGGAGQLPCEPASGKEICVHCGRGADLAEPHEAEVVDMQRIEGCHETA